MMDKRLIRTNFEDKDMRVRDYEKESIPVSRHLSGVEERGRGGCKFNMRKNQLFF